MLSCYKVITEVDLENNGIKDKKNEGTMKKEVDEKTVRTEEINTIAKECGKISASYGHLRKRHKGYHRTTMWIKRTKTWK